MTVWRHADFAKRVVIAAVVAAIVAPLVAWGVYGGLTVWPGLAGNFTASLLAFLCALAWDRREKQRGRAEEEAEREREREEEETDHVRRIEEARLRELEERRSEARRRFSLVLAELHVNEKGLDEASGSLAEKIVLPQLSDRSWVASGAALGAIASDYELVAALSTFYGRVRDLQWRLRRRLEIADVGEQHVFDGLAERLVYEMKEELAGLVGRVSEEAEKPSVIEVPFLPAQTVVYAPAVRAAAEARSRRVVRGSGSRPVGPPWQP